MVSMEERTERAEEREREEKEDGGELILNEGSKQWYTHRDSVNRELGR